MCTKSQLIDRGGRRPGSPRRPPPPRLLTPPSQDDGEPLYRKSSARTFRTGKYVPPALRGKGSLPVLGRLRGGRRARRGGVAVPSGPAVALGRRVRARFDAASLILQRSPRWRRRGRERVTSSSRGRRRAATPSCRRLRRESDAAAAAQHQTQRRPAPHERGRLPRGRDLLWSVRRSQRRRRRQKMCARIARALRGL